MGTIAHILSSFKGRGYEQIVTRRLLQRLSNRFPKALAGKVTSRKTAESYVSNCAQLGIVKRIGGYLHLTAEGEVLLCLIDFSNVPPPFELSPLEKAFFLNQILKLDKPCFHALLQHLQNLNEASLAQINRTIEYPTYRKLKIGARIHRIGARIEWAVDLGLVRKKGTSYNLSESGERFLSSIDYNPWNMIAKTLLDKIPEELPSYEWFLRNLTKSYSLLADHNPFDFYVKLASLRLHMRLLAVPDWNLQEETFGELFGQVWKKNRSKVQLLSSMKKEQLTEVLSIEGRQYKYIYIQ